MLLDDTSEEENPVQKAKKKFKNHPSIIDIRKHVVTLEKFKFREVSLEDMLKEIKNLDGQKSGPFMDIPVKRLKETADIVAEPLVEIWTNEIVRGRIFQEN